MCGRFSEKSDLKKLAKELGIAADSFPKRKPRYNISPSQPVMALIHEGRSKIDFLTWGLVPSWAKDAGIGNRMINARSETIAEKPSFRGLLRSRRCLIVADGFYEWKKQGPGKQPYYIRLKNEDPFTFAGLWTDWCSRDGSEIRSCAIITTGPNALMRTIHPRMPVILPREQRANWLDPAVHRPDEVLPMLQPFPAEGMEAFPVSAWVNTPAHDSPQCIAPVDLLS